MSRFLLRQVSRNHGAIQRCTLLLCAFVLVVVTGWGNGPALARYEQRPAAQVSPLGTPITVTTSATITGALNAPTSPLASEVTTEVTAGITAGLTVAITSVLTTAINTATTAITKAAPVVEAPSSTVDLATVELVNRGQISLYLVGAVLAGLLVLVLVVIGRQR